MAERKHPTSPCADCPYRMDSKRRHWNRIEFENVLASEAEPLGRIFSCHKHAILAPEKRGMCAGWLLNQKQRSVPSIMLRIEISRNPAALAALRAVKARGLKMFRSVQAMCRANGVAAPEPKPDRWKR